MIQQCPTETPALTPAGRASLQREIQTLHRERLPALTAQRATAHEDPAVRNEDAGLLELLPEHSRLDRRATEIERLLAVAREIVPPTDGVVALGSHDERTVPVRWRRRMLVRMSGRLNGAASAAPQRTAA